MVKHWPLLLILFFIVGCSGISIVNKSRDELYRSSFLHAVDKSKELYLAGNSSDAIEKLLNFKENGMLPTEKALRSNFIGVIYFNEKQYDKALHYFKESIPNAEEDPTLTSQIYLNLGSVYYKRGQINLARENLSSVDVKLLSRGEISKYYQLRYYIFQDSVTDSLYSLVKYFGKYENFSLMKKDDLFPRLNKIFSKLEGGQRSDFIYQFEGEPSLAAVYLAGLEAERSFYSGEKDKAKNILEWLVKEFSYDDEFKYQIEAINFRINNFSKINVNTIGVVLPISGQKSKFAKRVLMGIDSVYSEEKMTNKELPEIIVRDDLGNGAVGAQAVEELVKKYSVPVIVGGLFSDEAREEYLMARKYGVFFISLSEVYLEDHEKDFLLLEIPGSVESQVDEIISEQFLQNMGKRVAVIYPKDRRGRAYINRFWKKAEENGLTISSVQYYQKNVNDFRDSVKKLLSLDFKRERNEEYEIFSKIYSLSDNTAVRRLQILPPIIDFDWIFAPSYPDEAIRLIPTFHYFDVNKIPFVGIPSWRSQSLKKISGRNPLYFVGDDINNLQNNLKDVFYKRYGNWPSLIEIMSFMSFKVALSLLNKDYSSRTEFHDSIIGREKIEGPVGMWVLKNNLWIKKLKILKFYHGNISGLDPLG